MLVMRQSRPCTRDHDTLSEALAAKAMQRELKKLRRRLPDHAAPVDVADLIRD
jgi:hypothetical protein